MTSDNIRHYCEKALNITEQEGIEDGLTFLIGEKFSLIYYQLKATYNKLKYLYPDITPGQDNPLLKKNKILQLSYTLTINENYKGVLERVNHLESILKQFVEEIKESFPIENINDYLNSYPRLAFKEGSSNNEVDFLSESSPMTAQEIFSEVEDILIVNEMKDLFN